MWLRGVGACRGLILFLDRSVAGARVLGIQAVARVPVQNFSRDVRPKLVEDPADGSFGGHDKAVADGLAPAGVLRWAIQIRDAAEALLLRGCARVLVVKHTVVNVGPELPEPEASRVDPDVLDPFRYGVSERP